MRYIVPDACDGMLLRTYLCQVLRLSHRHLARLKRAEDGILLGGRRVSVRAVLRAGDELVLASDEADETSVVPGGQMPPVLYEDEDILICNKLGDMPTHPSQGHFDDTLANAVAAYDIARTGQARVFRPITRLDRETSGIVLIARTRHAATLLSEQMRLRQIQKTYLAILDGAIQADEGQICAAIRRARESIILREICDEDAPGAQRALTHYRVLAKWSVGKHTRTLVKALPETGRTHQLRLHFAHVSAPIAGDGLYGHDLSNIDLSNIDSSDIDTPSRQCLHAYALTFTHPIKEQSMTVTAPIPDDMARHLPPDALSLLTTPLKGD